MNGRGVYCSADGRQVEGYFENDNFVRSIWKEDLKHTYADLLIIKIIFY